jgi:hypothetical protein
MSIENEQVNAEQQANGILSIQKVTEDAPAPEQQASQQQQAPADVGGAGTVTDTTAQSAPVMAPVTPDPIPAKPAEPTASELTDALANARKEATAFGTMVLDQIAAYIDGMAPKKQQDPNSISRWQVSLYRALCNAANKCDTDFYLIWGAILGAFHQHKDGVFHETAVFRGMEHVALPPNDQKGLQRLLNLIKITANPVGRQAACKQVDFARTLEFGVTEEGRQRLLGFYNQ